MLKNITKNIRNIDVIVLSFFILITFLIYSNTLNATFHFDDEWHILENKNIRITSLKLNNFKDVINGSFTSRPFPMITFAINYYFGHYNVIGYHIVNISIHLINGILLYFLIKTTLSIFNVNYDVFFLSFFTALIWLVHPIQTQSVTYIIQRMNSMAAMFYILSLLCYVKGRIAQKNKNNNYKLFFLSCVVSGIIAMGCKEIAATLPFFIILYEWYFFQDLSLIWFSKHIRWIIFISVFISIYAFIILVQTPEKYLPLNYSIWNFTLTQRLLTELRVVIYYINLLFYPNPYRLNLDYDFPLSYSLINPITTLLSLVIIIGLIILSFYTAKKKRLISFGILWFLGNLAIESSIFPLDIIFEHRTYLPSMFISLIFVLFIYISVDSKYLRTFFLCTIVFLFSVWTYQRNNIWKDEFSLWQDCVKKSPRKGLPHINLGNALENQGNIDEAIKHYFKALTIKPYTSKVYNNLGYALTKKSKLEEAAFHYNEAIKLDGNYAKAYNGLGVVKIKQGKINEAVLLFSKAISIDPENTYAKDNLDKIEKQYKDALVIDPNFIPALNNLAILYAIKEEYDNSLSLFKKIVELKADNADTNYNIARIYAVKNMKEEAVYWLNKSINKGFNKWHVIKNDKMFYNIRDTKYYKEMKRSCPSF